MLSSAMWPAEDALSAWCCRFELAFATNGAAAPKQSESSHHSNPRISFTRCHLSIHVLPYSFIYCYDLKLSVFSSNKMATQLMNIDIIVNKRYSRIKFTLFPFALLGNPRLSYPIHPVSKAIHLGVCAKNQYKQMCLFSRPQKWHDLLVIANSHPKITTDSEFYWNVRDNIHKAYPGPKSTDVCLCATASHFSRWISRMNETWQSINNSQPTRLLRRSFFLLLVCHFWDMLKSGITLFA